MSATPQALSGNASLSDILSAIKNLVLGISTIGNNYLNVQGQITYPNISAPTVIKSAAGRTGRVSVITAGSTTGIIYDAISTADTSKPIYVIPQAVGNEPYDVDLPVTYGIVVSPGSGQVVSVSFS